MRKTIVLTLACLLVFSAVTPAILADDPQGPPSQDQWHEIIKQICFQPVYKNHGEYVSCIAHTSEQFLEAGLITEEQKDLYVSTAAQSDVGK